MRTYDPPPDRADRERRKLLDLGRTTSPVDAVFQCAGISYTVGKVLAPARTFNFYKVATPTARTPVSPSHPNTHQSPQEHES